MLIKYSEPKEVNVDNLQINKIADMNPNQNDDEFLGLMKDLGA